MRCPAVGLPTSISGGLIDPSERCFDLWTIQVFDDALVRPFEWDIEALGCDQDGVFRHNGGMRGWWRAHNEADIHPPIMESIPNRHHPSQLGGVVEWCDQCQYTHTRYRSCRDRHCPKCQGAARAKWLEQRTAELLPTPDPATFGSFLEPLQHKKWVVYAKAPFGGPPHVLEYLGRYTHRVAISNRRLLALQNGHVSFEWKDYRDDGKSKVMTVPVAEFIRRFLQHVVPPGLQRIRYFGFLANCHRKAKLSLCRQLLATACSQLLPQPADCRDFLAALTRTNSRLCPQCRKTILIRLQFFPPCNGPVPLRMDSS